MNNFTRIIDNGKPRIVMVGGGFGGIELAKALHQANAQIILTGCGVT